MPNRSCELTTALAARRIILTEGAMVERLRRDPRVGLDPFVANAALIYTPSGRQALLDLWREYIETACRHDLEIILFTPTWRVNAERLRQAGLPDVHQVVHDAFALFNQLRAEYSTFGNKIFIGGLVGCRGDAYAPQEALSAERAEVFHLPHVRALAESGVDFLLAATLPALSESIGLAKAMSQTEISYGISFVVRPTGTLLDGTPIADAIATIDGSVSKPPIGYFANCVR
jgi:homocysteine S-methyltransferase